MLGFAIGGLALLVGGALLLSGSGGATPRARGGGAFRPGSGRPRGAEPRTTCQGDPAWAARFNSEGPILSWVDCTDRTAADVMELVRILRADGRTQLAAAAESRWNARRSVESAPPDGALTPEGEREATGSTAAEEPRPFDDAVASESRDGGTPRRRMVLEGLDFSGDDAPRGGESRPEGAGPYWMFGDPSAPEGTYVPSTFDASAARRLAGPLARAIRESHEANRPVRRIRDFQRAAGLRADGLYGARTYQALRYFGVATPPEPYVTPPFKSEVIYVAPTTRHS